MAQSDLIFCDNTTKQMWSWNAKVAYSWAIFTYLCDSIFYAIQNDFYLILNFIPYKSEF